jgi:hypothetical protein
MLTILLDSTGTLCILESSASRVLSLRSKVACSLAGPISPQELPQQPHQCRIGIVFDPHLPLPQFDACSTGRGAGKLAHSKPQRLDGRLAVPKPSCPATSETCREVSISVPRGLLADMSASAE